MLRSAPCFDHPTLNNIDKIIRSCIGNITNTCLTDNQWKQASLPVRDGGLGIRSVSSLAQSAFLASVSSTLYLQSLLTEKCAALPNSHFDSLKCKWSSLHTIPTPTGLQATKQKSWDEPFIKNSCNELRNELLDNYHRACFNAASAPHSGDWLQALPITSCGLRLDDEAIRVAVCLRLGANLCEPHQCPCGAFVDASGSHGLSCKQGSGKTARHSALNDIIWRSLNKAGVPAVKEPSGLSRTDGKRPDGLSLIPWQCGKSVVWDVTVINTLAHSYISTTASTPGAAAEIAIKRKETKYIDLLSSYIFVPIAFETLGSIGSQSVCFLKDLGRRLTASTGDVRESVFLFQRLSICVQRFNAVCFRNSFAVPDAEEDH